ncbi:outer membrane beta-barrel protein [Legionella sp.]|uniref:outer membrane beta-barrel protein n=1 Tax=Legionella sp. TaxID=459 RepID=UPI003C86F203
MIHKKKSKLFLLLIFFLFTPLCKAEIKSPYQYPFYLGLIAGYGSTTWQGLVANEQNQNLALMLSTPIEVEEGGATWGVLAGYELSPYFAIEANYMRYPNSTIYFNEISIFSFTHDGMLSLNTKTESISLMGKIMLLVPHSNFRIYSSTGAAALYRRDIIVDNWRLTPTFGVGVNYNFTEHLMGELAGNYTAGFGETQLSPADTYFPFLYSITARIAFRF